MSEFKTPDYIVVKILWTKYTPQGKRKDVPNNFRRAMMGLGHAIDIPRTATSRMKNTKVILPYAFALIKEKTLKAKPEAALGAIAFYHYIGPADKIEESCKVLIDIWREIKNRKLDYLPVGDFEVITASRRT